jgi:dTDP-4-amino-4,6-dideoxygalactose transaminase
MPDFLPFALPDLGEEEIAEVVDSLRSCWVTTGPKTKRFEQEFSVFIGDEVESIAVNSATSGLHLALEAIGVSAGDEVITTPYTFTATAEVIRYLGADPVFVDIDPATFNIDVNHIEDKITSRTKAILPVHFAGLACNMDAIFETARKHGLKVIEDAAHALPTRYRDNLIGTMQSDVTVFSFYATKTITTGEGGMIVTCNPKIAERCRVMRLHGISRDAFDRYTSSKPAWHYEVIAPGFKYNMTDIAASMGIHQLKKAVRFQQRRQELAEYYDSEFGGLPILLPPRAPKGDLHAWHLYVIRLTDDAPVERDEFFQMMADKGIGCSVHFIPLPLQPYWRDTYDLKPEDFPNALHCYERAVSLPLYTKMSDEDAARVVTAVKEIFSEL